jgi:hypothetical protein
MVDLTPRGQVAPETHGCLCPPHQPSSRGRANASAAVTAAAVLAGGSVLCVLLLVVRDVIITTLASTSLVGLALSALLRNVDGKSR